MLVATIPGACAGFTSGSLSGSNRAPQQERRLRATQVILIHPRPRNPAVGGSVRDTNRPTPCSPAETQVKGERNRSSYPLRDSGRSEIGSVNACRLRQAGLDSCSCSISTSTTRAVGTAVLGAIPAGIRTRGPVVALVTRCSRPRLCQPGCGRFGSGSCRSAHRGDSWRRRLATASRWGTRACSPGHPRVASRCSTP